MSARATIHRPLRRVRTGEFRGEQSRRPEVGQVTAEVIDRGHRSSRPAQRHKYTHDHSGASCLDWSVGADFEIEEGCAERKKVYVQYG